MDRVLFENQNFKVMVETHELPWIKIFTVESFKEMSELPKDIRLELFELTNFIECEMIDYFKPDKINLASFGNYVPHVHMHIQARFKDDSFFPEPTWGIKQRDGKQRDCEDFNNQLETKLQGVTFG
ncbi:MAG TPA: HIT family protein [Arcobacter sp.]|jgi:diadenosine tetraphosphate (Ap4A) HIT family hydrolase|nr:HIT family protein [Arcobacter sp.]